MSEKPRRRSHSRALYMFLLVALFGVWKLFHQDDTHPWEVPAEPAEDVVAPPPADPLTELADALNGARPHQPTPEPTPFEHRYAVKWTDRSQAAEVKHEKRGLTLREAGGEAGWISQHARRYYAGAEAARSPFAELGVYLQCLCGRDVLDLTETHTVPGSGDICPYSRPKSESPARDLGPPVSTPL